MAPRKADPEPPVESETSETSESSSSEEEVPAVVPRKKVPLNEARLEQLRQAREKAAEARKRIGDVKRAEKALKERELQARIERVQAMAEKQHAWVSEWSKEPDSSSGTGNRAWVQIPPQASLFCLWTNSK